MNRRLSFKKKSAKYHPMVLFNESINIYIIVLFWLIKSWLSFSVTLSSFSCSHLAYSQEDMYRSGACGMADGSL